MHKKAFTLIKLLVVIAIIALFISIAWGAILEIITITQSIEFEYSSILPPNATNVKPLSTNWCYFDLDGRTFLFYVFRDGYSSLTEISKVKISKIPAEKE